MIKTSRQIRTEEDRFGGYIPRTESSRRNVEVDLDVDPDKELSFSRRTFVEPEYDKETDAPKKEESFYSTLDKPRRTVTPPARKPSAVRRDAEDVMPSIRTHDAAERHEETEPDRSAGLLSTRTKVMLAIYVAVAVVLAAIVIATGIALSSSTASVASLEAQVAARNATIAEQTSQILALEPSAVRRDAEDVMPSIRTHDAAERHEETEPDRSAGLLSTRTKVMLAIYVAVAVVLAAIVIATGIALSSSTASVASLEAQVAARNATIAEQTSQILALEDDTLLSGMATEQGMSHVSSVTEFELLPVEDAPAVTANTNWFDRFCDWLSKIL